MAIIAGREPPATAQAPQGTARVVIKLHRAAPPAATALQGDTGVAAVLRQAAPGAAFLPLFDPGVAPRAAARAPFDRYLAVETSERSAAEALATRLRALPGVEEAYVEAQPAPPPQVNAADDPLSTQQGYLRAAPLGIDAAWAWERTDGAGVGLVDLEQGWTLAHEDLQAAGITLISGVSQDFHGHGTAVLGQIAGVDNSRGVVGIAPRASVRVVSQWRTASRYSTAEAILSATDAMQPGDVLLLEAQTDADGAGFLPVEVETAAFDAIRAAFEAGIVVVEAAGNGGRDLDTYTNAAGRSVLNRGSSDFRDSGAILVGAASADLPHRRLGFSNHGSRVDCFGWGGSVTTSGDGWRGTSTTEYTSSFGGTSSASPIVAGAAVLLQSWRRARLGSPYPASIVRGLLRRADLNTPSADPAADRIGVMPDLRAIMEDQTRRDALELVSDRFVSAIQILIGLIDDSPGFIWVPGRGPIPVDPDWIMPGNRIAAPKRDLLAALAVTELADRIADGEARARLTSAAADAMRRAVERISSNG